MKGYQTRVASPNRGVHRHILNAKKAALGSRDPVLLEMAAQQVRQGCNLSRSTDDDALVSRALGGWKIESWSVHCAQSEDDCLGHPDRHRKLRSGTMLSRTFVLLKFLPHRVTRSEEWETGKDSRGAAILTGQNSCPILVPINERFSGH